MVHARVYTGARTRQRIAQIALSKIKNQSYHSANPISLPSHAHQISSSSSLASTVLVVGTVAATGWDVPSSLSEPEPCDEDTLRFDAADSTPSRFTVVSSYRRCVAKARIDEKILQRVVQHRTDILSREPRWMREAPWRTEQNMRLRRGCDQSRGKMS